MIAQLTTQASKVRDAALEKLFATLGQDEFATALKEAQQADVHPQVLLEARFLNLIDLGDNAAIAAMAPELSEKRDTFDPNHSEVFALKDDWLAIVHYGSGTGCTRKQQQGRLQKTYHRSILAKPPPSTGLRPTHRKAPARGSHAVRQTPPHSVA